MKQPIAMSCTQEQFEAIKPKIFGFRFDYISDFNENTYLTNYLQVEMQVATCTEWFAKNNQDRHVLHEEWNEKIFLEACGIETEKTFSITESQIKELIEKCPSSQCKEDYLKELFPEAFESEVKNIKLNTWYKSKEFNQMIIFVESECENGHLFGYGFDKDGQFTVDRNKDNINWCLCNSSHKKLLVEATEQEVFESLKNEAVKRGVKEGVMIKNSYGEELISEETYFDDDYEYDEDGDFLYKGFVLFQKGKWAEIIPTITLSEAEQKLGKKIIV